ncbi:hypothetical protein PENSPDRAFT_695498 [Peniophora sp. CONT]|nr:hypothetical protein PENSPDRAFT_695498 [Peniophora sp. CONT]
MPHVDPANYPTDLPEGVFHIDTDDTDDYRAPHSLDHDYILWAEEDVVTHTNKWWYRTSGRATPLLLDNTFAAIMSRVSKERRIRDQAAEIQSLQAQLPAAQAPAVPAATRLNIRLGTPHTFTGITNDKGVYDPTPRDFVRNAQNYIFAQEKQTGVTLGDVDRIMMLSTFLDQSAAMWYEQEVKKAKKWEAEVVHDPTLVYTGTLRNLDHFTDTLLKQFGDVDIKKTAIHKISTILQGTSSAEVHVRLFKDWAAHTGFNDPALIVFFKKSLKLALLDKVNGQGKHVPETIEGWYEDTVRFDRQWDENHLDRKGTSTSTSTPRANTQQQQQQPRNTNQWTLRTNNGQFRPWGSVTQPAQQQQQPQQPYRGPVPMDVDAMTRDPRCFKCGKIDGHFASNYPMLLAEI